MSDPLDSARRSLDYARRNGDRVATVEVEALAGLIDLVLDGRRGEAGLRPVIPVVQMPATVLADKPPALRDWRVTLSEVWIGPDYTCTCPTCEAAVEHFVYSGIPAWVDDPGMLPRPAWSDRHVTLGPCGHVVDKVTMTQVKPSPAPP